MSLFEVTGLKKVYSSKLSTIKVEALNEITFSVESGEFVAIMGESGSGKTTLLNILALLDRPTEGKIVLNNIDLSTIKENEMARFRRDNLGYIFQDYNLIDNLTVKDNVLLPLVLKEEDIKTMEEKIDPVLEKLNIKKIKNKYPYEISGGEGQRTAVARALITNPKIIFADEPTGALDSKSSDRLLEQFVEINSMGQTILMVTHSIKAASYASRVLFIKDGQVFHQIYKGNKTQNEVMEDISNTVAQLGRGVD
ncbi:MAG: ABC transporter ATP-binding protein [Tissierellia bacterium]|nr:ABC transporter ATP-binding protein [Tissierellia bacterium]